MHFIHNLVPNSDIITIYVNKNNLEDRVGELEHHFFASELPVYGHKRIDLVLNVRLLCLIQMNLECKQP